MKAELVDMFEQEVQESSKCVERSITVNVPAKKIFTVKLTIQSEP